jgi:hypothetical protein
MGEGRTTYTFSVSVNAFSVEFPLACYQQVGRVWYVSGALWRTYMLFYPAPKTIKLTELQQKYNFTSVINVCRIGPRPHFPIIRLNDSKTNLFSEKRNFLNLKKFSPAIFSSKTYRIFTTVTNFADGFVRPGWKSLPGRNALAYYKN